MQLIAFAQSEGALPSGYRVQLKFVWYELVNGNYGLSKLRVSQSLYEATQTFEWEYEMPNASEAHTSERKTGCLSGP
jgi:hypothetical protein